MSNKVLLRIESKEYDQGCFTTTSISTHDDLKNKEQEEKIALAAQIIGLIIDDLGVNIERVLEAGEMI